MTDRIRVKELSQKQGLRGEVVNLFYSWRTGNIHGNDGIFFARGAKVPTAINMQRVHTDQAEAPDEIADRVSSPQVGAGMVS